MRVGARKVSCPDSVRGSRNSRPSMRFKMACPTDLCRQHEMRAQARPQYELNSHPNCLAANRKIWRRTSSPSEFKAPKVSQTIAQNEKLVSVKLLSYLPCFWVSAYSSHGLSKRIALLLRALVIATSIASAPPAFHLWRVTSPGRRPVVLPKMPCFSSSGDSRPSDAKLSTRLRRVLCRMMISPFRVQQVACVFVCVCVCLCVCVFY